MMNKDFVLKNNNGVEYYISPHLQDMGFVGHFFSTRIGGISSGPYGSLNLGIFSDDNELNVKRNLEIIFEAAGMKSEKIVYLSQVHGDEIAVVNGNNCESITGKNYDALITGEKNIAIGIFTADCVPVMFVDTKNKIAAAAHAGWKGTYLKIAAKVVQYMMNNMNSSPKNILAAVGPSIGPCCFEVGEEVAGKFTFVTQVNDRYYVDLWEENKKQLLDLGIPDSNIGLSMLCTMCNSDTFYSHRRDAGMTGRMGSFIEIF